MSRYIDADAFVADSKWCGLETAEQVLFALDHQPSIDIVFCKDCMFWKKVSNCMSKRSTGYCDEGKRREP